MSDEKLERYQIDALIADREARYLEQDVASRVRLCGEFAMATWKGLTLINGGSIVALFTLVGASALNVHSTPVWFAFAAFASGLALSMASNILGYVCQGKYLQQSATSLWNANDEAHGKPGTRNAEPEHKAGERYERLALASASGALATFVIGAILALVAVLPNASPPANKEASISPAIAAGSPASPPHPAASGTPGH